MGKFVESMSRRARPAQVRGRESNMGIVYSLKPEWMLTTPKVKFS